jgi:hypothetical protein
MKHLLLTTIAAVVLVGCGGSQQSAPTPESKPEPPTAKAPDISIHDAVSERDIKAVKQHLAAGTDVNAKDDERGQTPLEYAAITGRKELVELLIANGADVNALDKHGRTHLHAAAVHGQKEIAELLIAGGADVNALVAVPKYKRNYTPLDLAIEVKRNRRTPPQTRWQESFRIVSCRQMKHLLLTTIAAVVLVTAGLRFS